MHFTPHRRSQDSSQTSSLPLHVLWSVTERTKISTKSSVWMSSCFESTVEMSDVVPGTKWFYSDFISAQPLASICRLCTLKSSPLPRLQHFDCAENWENWRFKMSLLFLPKICGPLARDLLVFCGNSRCQKCKTALWCPWSSERVDKDAYGFVASHKAYESMLQHYCW